MRAKAAACLLLVPLLVVECSAQSSFRDTATNLLKDSQWFKATQTADVPAGKYCYTPGPRQLKDAKEAIAELFEAPLYNSKTSRTPFNAAFLFGVVTATPQDVTQQVRFGPIPAECQRLLQELIETSQAFRRQFWIYDVAVTPEARTAGVPAAGGRVLVAEKQLVAVTGIAQQSETADVEFVWAWHRTPLAEKFRDAFESGMWIPALARLRRYDTGWRIMSVGCGPTSPTGSQGAPYAGCEIVMPDPIPTATAYIAKPPSQ